MTTPDSALELVAWLVSILLGGGLIGSGATAYNVKKKAPVERDSIIVSGAETAVVTMDKALTRATADHERDVARLDACLADERAENERLRQEITRKDNRIESLERRVDDLQRVLDAVREELHDLRST